MLNPVQQTPLAFDPARQQITPPVPVPAPPQPRAADIPIQAGDTPQNKFDAQDQSGNGSPSDLEYENRQRADTANKLRQAYARLAELKAQASSALNTGDAQQAKQAAEEAAQVASNIQEATGAIPTSGLGVIQNQADQLAQGTPIPGSVPAPAPQPPIPGVDTATVIDLARSGLGSAKEVVDTAASIPQPIEDRRSIDIYGKQVQNAIVGVEAFASKVADSAAAKAAAAATTKGHVDIKA